MPFVKNISLTRRKTAAAAPAMSFSIIGTATGSAGYFTSSNNTIYTGATSYYPIYITLSTASLVGGTPPYICKWTASTGWWPPGYTAGTNTGSITVETYSYESERWTATITDSSTPPNVVSASIDSIVYGIDFEMVVGNFEGKIGNDNQTFDPLIVPGGPDAPLATINAGIKYAVPDNTYIYVASGTYAENPVINKKIYQIQSVDGETSASLGNGNYFIYATKEFGTSSLRQLNTLSGFSSSVFNTIGVSPSGSIQSAILDIEPSGTVQILEGVHEINTPISMSITNKTIRLNGVHVPTGSSDSYFYSPSSILRSSNFSGSIFIAPGGVTGASATTMSNLALEVPTGFTSSYITIANGSSINVHLEMVRFRIISSSVANEVMTLHGNAIGQYSNYLDESIPPGQRNYYYKLIFDATESSDGYGSGYVRPGLYSPYPRELFGDRMIKAGVEGISIWSDRMDVSISNASDLNEFSTLSAAAFSSRQPRLTKSSSRFNGLPHIKFNGIEGSNGSYLETSQTPELSSETSSLYMNMVFGTSTNQSVDKCLVKYGDHLNGYSVHQIQNGSSLSVSFYATGSDGTQSHVFMYVSGSITTFTDYMVEMFFDSKSTNKRVGMAIYTTSSLLTSSYFSSTEFPSTRWGNVASIGAIGIRIYGARLGGVRWYTGTTSSVNTLTTSRSQQSNFLLASSLLLVKSGSHSNKLASNIYNWARWKYFPTSSIVTRSISSDLS